MLNGFEAESIEGDLGRERKGKGRERISREGKDIKGGPKVYWVTSSLYLDRMYARDLFFGKRICFHCAEGRTTSDVRSQKSDVGRWSSDVFPMFSAFHGFDGFWS